MARGRLYKSEVKAARDKLLREGTNPSLDAVRIALGNTGSKTTIHRLMRELEAEEASAAVTQGEAISEALQALVAQLAAQLRQESDVIVAAGQERANAEVAAAQAEVSRLTEQGREASHQIQRLQTNLDDTRKKLGTTEQALRAAETANVGLRERAAGLERQLVDREAHCASIDAKHQQAREALEHFRLAAKEQREAEARQHEQAVQALQVELRRTTESVASKNDEVLALNRDNARLTEQAGQHAKELRDAQRLLQASQQQVTEANGLRQINESLEAKLSQAMVALESMRQEQATARLHWDAERNALSDTLREARAQADRWGTIESMLSSLRSRAELHPE